MPKGVYKKKGRESVCKNCFKAYEAFTNNPKYCPKCRLPMRYARWRARYHSHIERERRLNTEYRREWRKRFPEKAKASDKIKNKRYRGRRLQYPKVHQAINNGKLVKPKKCSKCGKCGTIEGHHPNYNKPLEVIWLCRNCHRELHQLMNRRIDHNVLSKV